MTPDARPLVPRVRGQVIPGGKVPDLHGGLRAHRSAELSTAQLYELDLDYWDRMQPPAASKKSAAD